MAPGTIGNTLETATARTASSAGTPSPASSSTLYCVMRSSVVPTLSSRTVTVPIRASPPGPAIFERSTAWIETESVGMVELEVNAQPGAVLESHYGGNGGIVQGFISQEHHAGRCR